MWIRENDTNLWNLLKKRKTNKQQQQQKGKATKNKKKKGGGGTVRQPEMGRKTDRTEGIMT